MTAYLSLIGCQKKNPDSILALEKPDGKPNANTSQTNKTEETYKPETYIPETKESAGFIEVSDKVLSFRYQVEKYKKIIAFKNPKFAVDPNDLMVCAGTPAYISYQLEDIRPLPALEQGPRYFEPAFTVISLIPLQDASVTNFATAYPMTYDAARELKKLLQKHPIKPTLRPALPDLPCKNAGQSIISKFQYVNFKSGKGILLLTQYTQEEEPNPINNEELTGNFQGLTDDGKYYVAATFSITHPSLPKGIDFTQDIKRDKQGYYLRRAERQLEGYSDESFQPSLSSLKQIISSISVKE